MCRLISAQPVERLVLWISGISVSSGESWWTSLRQQGLKAANCLLRQISRSPAADSLAARVESLEIESTSYMSSLQPSLLKVSIPIDPTHLCRAALADMHMLTYDWLFYIFSVSYPCLSVLLVMCSVMTLLKCSWGFDLLSRGGQTLQQATNP